MKKNQILGLSIACFGVIASISTSFALYMKADADKNLGITVTTPEAATGNVNYLLGTVTNSLGDQKLSPDHRDVTYTVPLQAEYEKFAQDFIVGKISVDLTGDLAPQIDISAKVCGYNMGADSTITGDKNSIGYKTYGKDWVFPEGLKTQSQEVTVSVNGAQYLEVKLHLSDTVTDADFVNYAEKTYNLHLDWCEPTDFNYAYVIGDASNWEERPEYKMIPNINADAWEWTYKGLTGFAQAKFKNANGTYGGFDVTNENTNGNILLDRTTTYNAYWKETAKVTIEGNTIHSI